MDKEFTRAQVEEARQTQEMRSDIRYIKEEVISIKSQLQDEYVRKSEFILVRNAVFGIIGTIVTTVIIALLYTVINK